MNNSFPDNSFVKRTGLSNCLKFLIVGAALFTGCLSPHNIYVSDVNERGWSSADKVSVVYDNQDTVSTRNIDVVFRHSKRFEYDRLVVSVNVVSPAGMKWCDTIGLKSYTGDNSDSYYYEIEQPYRKNVVFSEQGRYMIEFRPVISGSEIKGVSAIGINIHD